VFGCGVELKNVVLREIFGGEMERLTGRLRKLYWVLGNGICGACETVWREWKL
jgi:hypothetical protein